MGFKAGCVPVGTAGGDIVRSLATAALALAFVAAGLSIAWADAPPDAPDCLDAEVSARLVRQTPTPIPDCGADCIVMSWPWILDLDVEAVMRGSAPTGRLRVLSVQHTFYRVDLGDRPWLLRRNARQGFNLLRVDPHARPKLCGKGSPAAAPYIDADRETLRKMEAEGRVASRGGAASRA